MPHLLFVVSGPSGSGKSTLVEQLIAEHPDIRRLTTTTTRNPRHGEVDEHDYYFRTRNDFKELIMANAFVEYAEYNGNLYGLTQQELDEKLLKSPAIAILETQGAQTIRDSGIAHRSVFINPPSVNELKKRIYERAADSAESIANRLHIAGGELLEASQYDIQIRNDDLNTATAALWTYIEEKTKEILDGSPE